MKRDHKRKALSNIAASSLIVAASMVGCTGQALHTQAGAGAGKLNAMADAQARDAEKALAAKDAAKAIQIAEAAVAASPNKADYRTLLGRAYLLDGRFASARTAFEDALTLGATDGRTVVNLALIHVAQGDKTAAQRLLNERVDQLTAADYGLAMAMAGNPDEAIRVLSQAIHAPTAGAKERQNLAYAYALAGQWTEARQVAALDLAPADAARRVLGWAQAAQPGADSQRVIAMMGVAPRADDAGLPVHLALGQNQPAPAQLAEAAPPTPATDFIPAPIADEPQADNAPVAAPAPASAPAPAQAPVTTPAPAPAPALAAASEEEAKVSVPEFIPAPRTPLRVAVAAPKALAAPAQPAVTPTPLSPLLRAPAPSPLLKNPVPGARPVALWQPVDSAKGSAWVVQLGAFSSPQAAKAGWNRAVRGNERLGLFPQLITQANVNGRNYHRVAIAGFGNKGGADKLCGSIRAAGGSCFVRLGGPEAAPVHWAKLKVKAPARLAMR
ncbi:SPOR domain-containing protein [Sphingobium sp. DEHP117]|uniref:SPOR domain-containing protein n=1 Tax=Sphingobium sp. DEHP117 TaxID=2993436 RepID=UPI0027D59401|nr:tetratricopeptide repeat protein [Sphingobium sp. DEHP117]MDQ4420821.1 SPOR domain-containing protein [Sphingobium sp. DEHP117]